jgi:hypothetical protein
VTMGSSTLSPPGAVLRTVRTAKPLFLRVTTDIRRKCSQGTMIRRASDRHLAAPSDRLASKTERPGRSRHPSDVNGSSASATALAPPSGRSWHQSTCFPMRAFPDARRRNLGADILDLSPGRCVTPQRLPPRKRPAFAAIGLIALRCEQGVKRSFAFRGSARERHDQLYTGSHHGLFGFLS